MPRTENESGDEEEEKVKKNEDSDKGEEQGKEEMKMDEAIKRLATLVTRKETVSLSSLSLIPRYSGDKDSNVTLIRFFSCIEEQQKIAALDRC